MKHSSKLILLASVALVAPLLTGCGGTTTTQSEVQKVISQAETMTRAELFKKSMEEIKGKKFVSLGNSSRGKTALEYLFNLYAGKKYDSATKTYVENDEAKKLCPNWSADFTAEFEWTQPKNNRIFTQISSDVAASNHTFSMTLIQDGNQIKNKMLDTGALLNYVPKEWKESSKTNAAANGDPLALQSLNKVFVFNNQGTKTFTNCWDFVGNGFKTQFMAPNSEPVGKNFLYMLTQDSYSTVLKTALDAYAGTDKADIVKAVDANASLATEFGLSDVAKYGLTYIQMFVKQYVAVEDDGPIATSLVAKTNADTAGLLVYSKFRSTVEAEDGSTSNKYVTCAAYQDGYKGIGGFMYKHYLQILKTSPFPWTSCALINFMTTTSYGFSPWGKDMGGYCSDPESNQDHSKDGGTDFPIKNDKGYDWWTGTGDGKGNLVIEDPAWAAKQSYNLGGWIDSLRA